MKLLDYFFYVLSHWGVTYPGDDEGARMSSCNLLIVWIVFFSLALLALIGIIIDYSIYAPIYPVYFIIYGVIIMLVIHIRYYKLEKYYEIEEWRNGLSRWKVKIMYTLFLIWFWGTPPAMFILVRLYLYGQVKWW